MLRFRRVDRVLYEVVGSKAVLVHPDGTELLTLNAVGTLVWDALGEQRDARALADAVLAQVEGAERERVVADIAAFLDELLQLGLVEAELEPSGGDGARHGN